MNDTEPRSPASRLSVRFALILALALMPMGVVAFVQTHNLQAEVRARSEAALLGTTLRLAETETGLIQKARGLVGSLAQALPEVLDDNKACTDLMKRIAKLEPAASLVAFVPSSGMMTCSSTGKTYDLAENSVFRLMRDRRESSFVVDRNGPISGTSVLGISDPVFGSSGAYIGLAVISLPHRTLMNLQEDALTQDNSPVMPIVFWTFDGEGTMLSSNIDLAQAALRIPKDAPLVNFTETRGRVFQGVSQTGAAQIYAVVPIVADELYLMSSWHADGPIYLKKFNVTAYAPTLLMWLVGLLAAAIAAHRLVTRHVSTLNHAIVRFAKGDRRLEPINMEGAPVELDQLATAYLAMTESITRSEAELEDSVHQKEVLLREVHHRVKNNLQLISSIMNIQLRSAKTAESKELLLNLQERIMSLATVHRGLYQTSGLADVRARELIPDIVRQIMALSSGPEKPFTTQMDIDDLRLVPDQAVPLALLLVEALTNAMKHSGVTRDNPGHLQVQLKRSDGSDAVLKVINSYHEREPQSAMNVAKNAGIGSQLISAFVQQLGGRQESGMEGQDYSLSVTFTVAALADAEHRNSSANSDVDGWNNPAP